MAPKKAPVESPPPVEPEEEEEEEPAEPEILNGCHRVGGQLYHGEYKAGYKERKGMLIRHGSGQQVVSCVTPAGNRFSDKLAYETVVLGVYEGHWDENTMSGQGTYKWSDGSSYEGAFLNGQKNGHGVFVWPDGTAYQGMWMMGAMHGQGRLDSRFDGRFLQGKFHRNCYQNRNKQWVDVLAQIRQEELDRIHEGDSSSLSVRRCTFGESFADNPRSQIAESQKQALESMITAVHLEGLVPFLVVEDSLYGSVLECLGRANLTSLAGQCVSVRLAAIAKRRKRNYQRFFHDAIQRSLMQGTLFVTVFEDDGVGLQADQEEDGQQESWYERQPAHGDQGGAVPEDWRLTHFFGQSVLPPEIFNPTLFNGRGLSRQFVPEVPTKVSASGASDEAAKATAAAAAAPTPEGLGLTGHYFEPQVPPEEAGLQVAYCLRPAIAARAYLPAGLSDAEVRERILSRYQRHLPLHRTVVVLIGKGGDEEPKSP